MIGAKRLSSDSEWVSFPAVAVVVVRYWVCEGGCRLLRQSTSSLRHSLGGSTSALPVAPPPPVGGHRALRWVSQACRPPAVLCCASVTAWNVDSGAADGTCSNCVRITDWRRDLAVATNCYRWRSETTPVARAARLCDVFERLSSLQRTATCSCEWLVRYFGRRWQSDLCTGQ